MIHWVRVNVWLPADEAHHSGWTPPSFSCPGWNELLKNLLDFHHSATNPPIISGQRFFLLIMRQTRRNPLRRFCLPHPSLPKFSSLWLGGCRFPNKLAETCCLWVRPSSPPAGQQSCHPQCKQVALASQGEWAERVGVIQATPIQNSQLTSNTKATLALANPRQTLVLTLLCVLFLVNIFSFKAKKYCFTCCFLPGCLSHRVFLCVFALWGCCSVEWDRQQAPGQPPSVGR